MRTIAVTVLVGILLASAAFAEAVAPAKVTPTAAQTPAMVIQPESVPAPCVLQSLRFLNPQFLKFLSDKIELNYDQKVKVSEVLERMQQELTPLAVEQRKASDDFVVGLTRPGAQTSDLLDAADKAMKIDLKMLDQKIQALAQIRALLSPAQSAKLDELIDTQTKLWRNQPITVAAPVEPAKPAEKPAK